MKKEALVMTYTFAFGNRMSKETYFKQNTQLGSSTPNTLVAEKACVFSVRISAYFLAEISVRSPRKLFIFII